MLEGTEAKPEESPEYDCLQSASHSRELRIIVSADM
jgi:hypothetical protein